MSEQEEALPPPAVIAEYLAECAQEARTPSADEAMKRMVRQSKIGVFKAKAHLDAYALQHPGAFPKYRVPNPKLALLWMIFDLGLAAFLFLFGALSWLAGRGFPIMNLLLGSLALFLAYTRFARLGECGSHRAMSPASLSPTVDIEQEK